MVWCQFCTGGDVPWASDERYLQPLGVLILGRTRRWGCSRSKSALIILSVDSPGATFLLLHYPALSSTSLFFFSRIAFWICLDRRSLLGSELEVLVNRPFLQSFAFRVS